MMNNYLYFFFNDTATTEIYTLSLHDALPISGRAGSIRDGEGATFYGRYGRQDGGARGRRASQAADRGARTLAVDRKSTRLNSSHANISYAVFCLKKKKIIYFI